MSEKEYTDVTYTYNKREYTGAELKISLPIV